MGDIKKNVPLIDLNEVIGLLFLHQNCCSAAFAGILLGMLQFRGVLMKVLW